jgi:hypothetical protein
VRVRTLAAIVVIGLVLLVAAFDPYVGSSVLLVAALIVLATAAVLLARASWRGSRAALLLLAVDVGILVTTAWQFLRPMANCAYTNGGPDPRCETFLGFWNVYAVGAGAAVVVVVVGWLRLRAIRAA